jgi:hypothetical protein
MSTLRAEICSESGNAKDQHEARLAQIEEERLAGIKAAGDNAEMRSKPTGRRRTKFAAENQSVLEPVEAGLQDD